MNTEVLTDIREKLRQAVFQNEEHVRLSLVCRLLLELGWDIWNPEEVNTEYAVIPTEDRTKVDVALFADSFSPSVFVEIKAVGKVEPSLSDIERQVRDYNRNNTALFSVITDGRIWRFYYSQTGGEFHQKCFRIFDLIEDEVEDVRLAFSLFLEKDSILCGRAEEEARKYLQLSKKQRAVQDCLPQARRMIQAPPYPSLPQAVQTLLTEKGFDLSDEEAADLIENIPDKQPSSEVPQPLPTPAPSNLPGTTSKLVLRLNPEDPGDLRFTRVKGTIGGKSGKKWKELVDLGIRTALQTGEDPDALDAYLPANIRKGIYTGEGFSPIEDMDVSVQGMHANNSARTLLLLAKRLNCQLQLTVSWYGKSPNEGKQGVIEWNP